MYICVEILREEREFILLFNDEKEYLEMHHQAGRPFGHRYLTPPEIDEAEHGDIVRETYEKVTMRKMSMMSMESEKVTFAIPGSMYLYNNFKLKKERRFGTNTGNESDATEGADTTAQSAG